MLSTTILGRLLMTYRMNCSNSCRVLIYPKIFRLWVRAARFILTWWDCMCACFSRGWRPKGLKLQSMKQIISFSTARLHILLILRSTSTQISLLTISVASMLKTTQTEWSKLRDSLGNIFRSLMRIKKNSIFYSESII